MPLSIVTDTRECGAGLKLQMTSLTSIILEIVRTRLVEIFVVFRGLSSSGYLCFVVSYSHSFFLSLSCFVKRRKIKYRFTNAVFHCHLNVKKRKRCDT